MDRQSFERWVDAYGKAWEQCNAEAFSGLFTPEARYYWTPFGEPKRGRAEIARAFTEATNTQDGIKFEYEVFVVDREGGVAHWWCSFTRKATGKAVHLDGILMAKSGDGDECHEFREWWHSDE